MLKREYPILYIKKAKGRALDKYYEEISTLGEEAVFLILDHGKKWADYLANVLENRGAVIFPHTFVGQCGYQIAAAVHAVLDSGADQALLLGVLHPRTDSLKQARMKEFEGKDISQEFSWGVLGPGIKGDDSWKEESCLELFKVFFQLEIKRRGIVGPRLIQRYPSLVNRDPSSLPGINELKQIAKDSVIVATDDMCHHGVGYGTPIDQIRGINEQGYQLAREFIEKGYQLLEQGAYAEYFAHWMNPIAFGDPTDIAIVLHYILGNPTIKLLDIKLVDVSTLFEEGVSPSWVAASLVAFEK